MKEFEKDYPWSLSQTKIEGLDKEFNLSQVSERHQYFKSKVGKEIEELKQYLDKNTFIAYWLGKKNSGKGTYSKLMLEVFGKDRINHVSVGDVVREACENLKDPKQKEEIVDYLKKNYRGYISVDEAVESILNRDTKSLLPTEFILTLVKREIDKMPKKSLFVDGFPRNMDQVSYSLYFRDLINYREDPDVFIGIDIPEQVIDQRMKYRVVCPKCHTPRSLKLLTTQEVGYDQEKKEFYLMCDDPDCDKARMKAKEGDNLGIESIRDRLELDEKLITKIFSLHGMPKVLLRNALPVSEAEKLVDKYEITPEYYYELTEDNKVETKEKPWTVKDDEGREVYSLLAPPVVVSLIKQLHNIFVQKN